jgi:glutamate-1-semialdehyde 2,1-aminomutase
MEEGLREIVRALGLTAVVARQGSAFCLYFMSHLPRDWHDLAENHNFAMDENLRQNLIESGVYFFPLAAKQCSISFAHTEPDVDATLWQLEIALRHVAQRLA